MKQGIALVILSTIAMISLAWYKSTTSNRLLKIMVPLQGFIGLLFCFLGIFSVISIVTLKIDQIYTDPFHWIVKLSVNCMYVILGYILGYTLISQYVYVGSEQAKNKGYELIRKMAPIQIKLGLVGLVIGSISIICALLS